MNILNNKEKRVFGALSKLGEVPISAIAEETLINRTALYHTIGLLVKKGLASEVTKNKVAYFKSISLVEFDDWTKRQIKKLEAETQGVREGLIRHKSNSPSLQSDVRYFEGVEGMKNLYADSWRENEDRMIYAITDYEKAYETHRNFFEKEYFPARIRHGVRVKSLLPRCTSGLRDIKKAKDLLREMRFIDVFRDLGIEMNIYDDKISLVAFDKKRPTGIILKNEVMAEAFRKIFEYLWKTAR